METALEKKYQIQILERKAKEYHSLSSKDKKAIGSQIFKVNELIAFLRTPKVIIDHYFDPNEKELSKVSLKNQFQLQVEKEIERIVKEQLEEFRKVVQSSEITPSEITTGYENDLYFTFQKEDYYEVFHNHQIDKIGLLYEAGNEVYMDLSQFKVLLPTLY